MGWGWGSGLGEGMRSWAEMSCCDKGVIRIYEGRLKNGGHSVSDVEFGWG